MFTHRGQVWRRPRRCGRSVNDVPGYFQAFAIGAEQGVVAALTAVFINKGRKFLPAITSLRFRFLHAGFQIVAKLLARLPLYRIDIDVCSLSEVQGFVACAGLATGCAQGAYMFIMVECDVAPIGPGSGRCGGAVAADAAWSAPVD